MSGLLNDIIEKRENIVKITLSEPLEKDGFSKAVIKPVKIKNKIKYQVERFKDKKVYHTNLDEDFFEWFEKNLDMKFAQALFVTNDNTCHYHLKNGAYKKKSRENQKTVVAQTQHDRKKSYILPEGENIPAFVELGIFTSDFKIVKSMYDKYKQINRFVELVDDAFSKSGLDDITVLDFVCGKSYLTFILYYYFTVKRNVKAKIIGYDLKADVVENCNAVAKKYGYEGLSFFVSDVTRDKLYDEKIDMIVTLHACDTATDYALDYAIKKGVKYIFSVPCCQHEVNKSIKKGGDMDILLKYGIIKERTSALLTDSIRAGVLEDMGYAVDVIEFIDFEHSPKNIMLRAKKCKNESRANRERAIELCGRYGFSQTLLELNR